MRKSLIMEKKMEEKICITCEYYTPFAGRNEGYCDLFSKLSTDDDTCKDWVKNYILHIIKEGEQK